MNQKVVLQSRPQDSIKLTDFQTLSEPLQTSLKLGEVLVRVEWISIDPAQRGN
jgi:NADPH-dependent curcumin reductase CurA